MSIELSKNQGIEMYRRRQTFSAVNPGEYSSASSSQVRIELNIDRETIDFDTGYLMFDLKFTSSGSTDEVVAPKWEASKWIKDIRVYDRAGREIGEQVRNYNALYEKKARLFGNAGANTNYLNALEGATGVSQLPRQTSSRVIAYKQFAHKICTHIFDIKSYFPAHLLGGLIIEIDMEDAAKVYKLNGTTDNKNQISYTLNDVRYVCDLVLLKPNAEAALRNQLNGGLDIHYNSPMNHTQTVQASSTNQRFDLGIANGNIKSIQAFMVKDSDRDGANEDHYNVLSKNGLTSYRFKLGSEYLTERDIKVADTKLSEYLVEFLKANNLESQDIVNFYGDQTLTLATSFVIGQKVELSKDASVSSGIRDTQTNKIELELIFDGTNTAGTLYTCVDIDRILKIKAGRTFINQN